MQQAATLCLKIFKLYEVPFVIIQYTALYTHFRARSHLVSV